MIALGWRWLRSTSAVRTEVVLLRERGRIMQEIIELQDQLLIEAETLVLACRWQPIATAPKGVLIIVWCPGREDLPPVVSLCAWHPDAGFCVDELREPTHWQAYLEPSP